MATTSWLCTVCGYVHDGEAPPDCCPVCGSTDEHFEPLAAASPAVQPAPAQWRCLNCDYLHSGSAPPNFCPVCGVGADQFESVAPGAKEQVSVAMSGAIVIIGSGIAGLSAAEAARNAAPGATITLLTREKELPYYRLNLTRYLAGEIDAGALPIHPAAWYADRAINLHLDSEVDAIDPAAKLVTLKGGAALAYDRLVLAMGAHPFMPPVPGANRRHVVTLRTRHDADRILGQAVKGCRCVVVGGGVLGLETAAALARREVQVSLLEGFPWLLPRQLNRVAAARLAAAAESLGISLALDVRIRMFDGDEQVRSVVLDNGQELPADLVVVAAGVRTNSYLARLAGLEVHEGVVVDHHLRTSVADIYAAGDLAEHQGVAYGTWAPAQFQGTIAGMNAAGGAAVFAGIPRSNVLKVLGVDMFSIGQVHPDDASYLTFEHDEPARYALLVFRDSRLAGAILVGDTAPAPTLKKLIESAANCSQLLAGARDAQGVLEAIGKPG